MIDPALIPDTLFIDGEALIVNKPAGLPIAPPRRGGLSIEGMADDLRFGFQRPPVPVHRLDQDTSGCLLLARNPKAMKRFQAAFEARKVDKVYIGVLSGVPDASDGVIDLALGKVSSAEAGWRIVPDPAGKAATTHWRVLQVAEGRALVEFRPTTGRTHQLRVHAASGLGLPLLGDPQYGALGGRDAPRLMLHALSIALDRGEKPAAAATAPVPDAMRALGFDWTP